MDDLAAAGNGAQPAHEPGVLRLGRGEFPPTQRLVMAIVNRMVISVDTWRHEPARAACEAGADLLNDT